VFLKAFYVSDRLNDATVNSPYNASQLAEFTALATHYGIPMVTVWDYVAADIAAGRYHLSDYLLDVVHPTAYGHALMSGWIEHYLTSNFLATRQMPTPLPARLYDNGDYENTAVIKNGTDYVALTGTWTPSGTTISSSVVNSTVTYSGTFQSFGRPEYDGSVQVSIDSGAYQTITFGPNGYQLVSRAAHTITIKVVSGTVTISEFWAI
jgi:hypothetical protein